LCSIVKGARIEDGTTRNKLIIKCLEMNPIDTENVSKLKPKLLKSARELDLLKAHLTFTSRLI